MNDADELIQRDPEDPFDRALRSELRWETPPELTTRLLALVADAPAFSSFSSAAGSLYARAQPKPWYTTVVMLLTAVVVGLSLAIAWQIYGALGAQLGMGELWQQIQLMPAMGLKWLYEELPITRYVLAVLSSVRDQLHWLLLAAVLWLALDGWSPNFPLRRQQTSS